MKGLFKSTAMVVLIFTSTIYFTSCENEPTTPVVTTTIISDITETSASAEGTLADDGGAAVTKMGVCWSRYEFPSINDAKTTEGVATGSYTSKLTGLRPGTRYFARAYAVNSAGIGYGNRISFITLGPGAQKADYPGEAHTGLTGFSIGTKVYMGLGSDPNEPSLRRDFWEYDPATNLWTRKSDFGGSARTDAVGFSIGNKGYIGTGRDEASVFNDFWEYDPVTDVWTKKADFEGLSRSDAVGFSIGTKGYIGTGWAGWAGWDEYLIFNDFWEYDPETNLWTKRADLPGPERSNAVGFSIGNKGYIGTGLSEVTDCRDFWEYDQENNKWTQIADFSGSQRGGSVGFSIASKGYYKSRTY